jgi:hypothetical protein
VDQQAKNAEVEQKDKDAQSEPDSVKGASALILRCTALLEKGSLIRTWTRSLFNVAIVDFVMRVKPVRVRVVARGYAEVHFGSWIFIVKVSLVLTLKAEF